jgi:hypothetical protein
MENKMKYQINLDQLKTLILIKGEERRVGRSLPSFISLTFLFPISLPDLPSPYRKDRKRKDYNQRVSA